jgi:hypothetical protein
VVSVSALLARLALALVAVALLPASARAETFAVNTPADGTVCNTITCSVRGAILAANGNGTAETDVITIPAGRYELSAQFPGGLTIASRQRVTISGAGANSTSIEPQSANTVRLLTTGSGAVLALSDITLRGGRTTSGAGGNLMQAGDSSVTLDRVRVTGGQAPQGGGIAVSGGGSSTPLNIHQSLIDGNTATGVSGTGGGLSIAGATFSVAATVTDSTIYNNEAVIGGGVAVTFNGTIPPAFRGVTLVGNRARTNPDGPAVGGISSTSAKVIFQGSIIAANTNPQGASNCAITGGATDVGGNVTPGNDCGLGGSHTDPRLITPLDETQQPPVLGLPADSPAIDIADCAGRTIDQRGVSRPQLNACDAGAFEYQPPPPAPTPTPTPPVATPTPTATATPTATPVRNASVGAEPVRGTVLVRQPGTSRFVELDASVIRNGSEVDTRKGRVEITTSSNERATFYDGIFRISQKGGVTTLTLTEALDCPKRSGKASAAAKKPKTRKLWGDGKGKFRTKGSYSAATVRGTKWLVQDGCRYTRTRVATGVVSVRDDVLHKTITLRKGKTYTARPRR